MKFEYKGKEYTFEIIDENYVTGEEYDRSSTYFNYNTPEREVKTLRNDLYCVSYKEKETGLIVHANYGLLLDITDRELRTIGDDPFTGCFDLNEYEVNADSEFEYKECTYPDDEDFDEDDFDDIFRIAAERHCYEQIVQKIENKEIVEIQMVVEPESF
ncbi:hypothetical protein BCT63_21090 [Vibrio kanaloae]|uniref:hypothetical protein n=1 Tax=Vibrio TaxID=662 RepID=UPI000C854FF9|nr:hypothetical protein [Vibrio kanaloae]MBM5432963.1 hypothetical protein [Vibrio parahaemolyticus]MBM5436500.1 hypothetical protein [Vibrio parahaemolyticus]MBM5438475.1 hypothetical protein [Vibrio parahaemolyticus]MCF9752937.1 hypothetical protein [Vibrio parahaemolyticus]MCF9759518.1 hypothetical protein [Vibrio parahaemolyticus]